MTKLARLQLKYQLAVKRHHGQGQAWIRLRDELSRTLRREIRESRARHDDLPLFERVILAMPSAPALALRAEPFGLGPSGVDPYRKGSQG